MRKVHLRVVLNVFVNANDDVDVVKGIEEADIIISPPDGMDVVDIDFAGAAVEDSR